MQKIEIIVYIQYSIQINIKLGANFPGWSGKADHHKEICLICKWMPNLHELDISAYHKSRFSWKSVIHNCYIFGQITNIKLDKNFPCNTQEVLIKIWFIYIFKLMTNLHNLCTKKKKKKIIFSPNKCLTWHKLFRKQIENHISHERLLSNANTCTICIIHANEYRIKQANIIDVLLMM